MYDLKPEAVVSSQARTATRSKTRHSGTHPVFLISLGFLKAVDSMASLLLKHLASSLTRQVAQMSRLTVTSSSSSAAAGAYRCLYRCLRSLTTAPRTPLLSSTSVGSIQPPSSGSSSALLGQCRHLPCIQPSAGMKTKSALKRRCKDCFIVRRRGRLFVFCKTNPRHKQRQG